MMSAGGKFPTPDEAARRWAEAVETSPETKELRDRVKKELVTTAGPSYTIEIRSHSPSVRLIVHELQAAGWRAEVYSGRGSELFLTFQPKSQAWGKAT